MKIITGFIAFLAFLFLASCENKDSQAYDKSLSPANTTKAVTPVTLADTLFSDSASTRASLPAANTNNNVGKPQITTTQTSAITPAAGTNPEHGKPGHRCDISVGAPLNSQPSKTATPQVSSVVTSPAKATPSVTTQPITGSVTPSGGGKLNPAHGQPGHDCAIAVGAPLKN